MPDYQDSLQQAFDLIQKILDDKDREIQALQEENAILTKEYDRVCQMLSIQEAQASKDRGFFSKLFSPKNQDEDVIEIPKEKSIQDRVLESFRDPDQKTWPLTLISYMQENPSPEDLVDLLDRGFPKDSPADYNLLIEVLDEEVLEKLLEKRPDLTLLSQRKKLPYPSLFKLLKVYYRAQDFFMVDHLLHELHKLKAPMPSRDLKMYYLLSLTRPVPLPEESKKRLEELFKADLDFQSLALAFLHQDKSPLTQSLAKVFADPKDQELLALAFTKLH